MTKSREKLVEQAIKMVKENKELEPYLISKLIEKSNPDHFNLLRDNDFFSNDKIPVIGEDGYVQQWNVLNYIISIIGALIDSDKYSDIEYIVNILVRVSEKNNNHMVFEQCMTIFMVLPSKYYKLETLSKFIEKQIDNIDNKEFISYILIDYLVEAESSKGKGEIIIVLKSILDICKDKYLHNRKYILEMILNNINIINEETCLDILRYIMDFLELELYEETSDINILDNSIELRLNKDNINLILNEECINKNISIKRSDAISEIIDTLKNRIIVDNEELDIRAKILYGGLFSKDDYYSIFQSKKYFTNVLEVLSEILKKIIRISKEDLTDIIDEALGNNYDYIKKMGIYMLVYKIENNNTFLDKNIISKYDFDYMVRKYTFDDEIKHIFNKLNDSNTDKEIVDIIDSYISKGAYIKYAEDDSYDYIWKQKRYEALKNIQYFKDKYNDIKLITGIDVELRAPISIECREVSQKSPFKLDEILNMSVDQLVIKMKEFKEYYIDTFEEISYNGFCNVLRESILLDYNKYLYDIDKFSKVRYEFILTIVETLAEIMSKEESPLIIKLIKFIKMSIENHKDDINIDENNSISDRVFKKRVFRILSDLLSNDDILMDKKLFDEVISLIESTPTFIESIDASLMRNNDYYFYFLNSYEGSLMTLILEVALKCSRQNNIQMKYWKDTVIRVLDKCAEAKFIDLYFIVGRYFNQFKYLDKSWTMRQIGKFINEDQWVYFIGGYLYSDQVIRENCILLDKHIEKALTFKFEDKNIRNRLIQHITIAYMNEFNMEKTQYYLNCIIKDFNIYDIKELIRMCYIMDSDKIVKGIKYDDVVDKIVNLWSRIVERGIKLGDLDEQSKKLLSESLQMLKNIGFFNDQIEKNIMFCSRQVSYDDYHMVVTYIYDVILSELNKPNEKIKNIGSFKEFVYNFMYEYTPKYSETKIICIMKFLKEYKYEYYELLLDKYIEKYNKDVYLIKKLKSV